MSLLETVKGAARTAKTEDEVMDVEAVIASLQEGKSKNVAILGEANCGKTNLINQLAGVEVRKTTKISMGEEPLMVTFHSDDHNSGPDNIHYCVEKEGYEVINISDSKWGEAQVSLYEIPISMAVDYETGQTTLMLEEMDAVIYITSAITPFSASDAANIEVIVNKIPMVLYVSKADLLGSDEEYIKVMEYIKDEFSQKFEGTDCGILDSRQPDAADDILEGIKELSLEELREFHIMRLEQRAKDIVAQGLRRQLEQLEAKRKEREADEAAKNAAYREQLLDWDELRLQMLEKKQEVMDIVDKEVSKSKLAAEKEFIKELKRVEDKKRWISHGLMKGMQAELEKVSNCVMGAVKGRTESDAAWLIGEVNKKFGMSINVADMKENGIVQLKGSGGSAVEEPKKDKLIAAAGSGLIAGGALFSSMSLISTCIVVAPAMLAMHHFVKRNREEQEQYNENLERVIQECCDKNFAALVKQIQDAVDAHYEDIVENIRNLSSRKKTMVDFSDIEEQRGKLSGMLAEVIQEI